jgi:hypothetical protein
LSAIAWLIRVGALVYRPMFEDPHCDLVADIDGRLVRVQVKTSTFCRNGRYEVALATRGGNQSWSGLVKRLDVTRCDYVFAHVGDGRRYFIPSSALGGGCAILLGGPKYAEYEVERGDRLQSRPAVTH